MRVERELSTKKPKQNIASGEAVGGSVVLLSVSEKSESQSREPLERTSSFRSEFNWKRDDS